MSPKFVDKDERKKEIALSALDLFASQGIERTSISRIAKAVGIGKGTVYEYFASKEDIVGTALIAWVENMMGAELEAMLSSIENPAERLKKSVMMMMETMLEDERTVKITMVLFQTLIQGESMLQNSPELRKSFHITWDFFGDTIADGVSQGIFRGEIENDARKIVVNLLAYLDGIAVHYLANKDDIHLLEQVEFYLDRLLDYLKV